MTYDMTSENDIWKDNIPYDITYDMTWYDIIWDDMAWYMSCHILSYHVIYYIISKIIISYVMPLHMTWLMIWHDVTYDMTWH